MTPKYGKIEGKIRTLGEGVCNFASPLKGDFDALCTTLVAQSLLIAKLPEKFLVSMAWYYWIQPPLEW